MYMYVYYIYIIYIFTYNIHTIYTLPITTNYYQIIIFYLD